MWRWLIAVFLVLHAIVFSFLDPESWLLDDGRGLYIALGVIATAGFVFGAILLIIRRAAARLLIGAAAAISLMQLLLFYENGLIVGVAINVGILLVVAWTSRRREERPVVGAAA